MTRREKLGAVGVAVSLVVIVFLGPSTFQAAGLSVSPAPTPRVPPTPGLERWQVSPTTACYTLNRAPLGCATELPPEPAEGYPRGWPQGNRT